MATQTSGRSQAMVKPSKGGRGIPPRDLYTLEFVQIVSYGLGKPFENEEPKEQFVLEFAILDYDDPDTREPMLIRGWFTNKWEHI
jgi:hypothetical protein